MVYEKVIKPILFKMDPEDVHDRTTLLGRIIGSNPITRGALALRYRYRHPSLRQTVCGITFENPVGLVAGFDKDCKLMNVLPAVGFGFEEVGSITNEPYEGNPKPRLVRLPEDKSIIVYYGLKNDGADAAKKRLMQGKKRKRFDIPIGVSVALTNKKHTSISARVKDWTSAVRKLQDCGDYITINVSCPNTFDPKNFNEPCYLGPLLDGLSKTITTDKPVFLKLSADIDTAWFDAIVKLCDARTRMVNTRSRRGADVRGSARPPVDGFILTNLVKDRSSVKLKSPKHAYAEYKGGLSGKIVAEKSLALTRHAYTTAGDRYVIIGVGGVFTAEDAYERIRAGASLVQLITGMIYGGPDTIRRINKGLVKLLERDGYKNISEAVGADCKSANSRGRGKRRSE